MINNDAAFLREVMDRHGITANQLKTKIGMDIRSNHVDKFLNGASTPPREVYTALIEMTGDMQLIELVFGRGGFIPVPRPKTNLAGSMTALKELIDLRQARLAEESAILKILADGKIDGNDFKAIKIYRQVSPEVIKLQMQLFEAINETFEKARTKS